jgi:hypothetical protein
MGPPRRPRSFEAMQLQREIWLQSRCKCSQR